jgi:hypothetical protein
MRIVVTSFVASFLLACSGAQTGAEGPDKTAGESLDESGDFAVCGDEVREGAEVCDGTDFGGQTCADVPGFVDGTLGCAADCTAFDTSQCSADPMSAIVRLNEITSNEIEEGDYAGAGDAIELVNIGQSAADLSGWALSDDAGFAAEKTYVFPSGSTLMPGEYLVLVKLDDTTMVGDYPFGISSTDPETLQLADTMGTVVESVDFSGADAGISWCRVPDGDGTWQHCVRTFGGTNEAGDAETTGPAAECGNDMREDGEACDGTDLGGLGCTDVSVSFGGGTLGCTAGCDFDTSACELSGDVVVVLNELSSSGDDEIEIYNAGEAAAALTGWILTDDLAAPDDPYDPGADTEALVFADGTMLAPGDYLVVPKADLPPGHPFGLGGRGDNVTLLDARAQVVDFVGYGADEALVSFCRIPDGPTGVWQADCTATFGAANES